MIALPAIWGACFKPFAMVGNTIGSSAAILLIGLTTNALAVFAPIPITLPVVHKLYLAPRFNPLPTSGIPPPIIAPSWPNFNLFTSLAVASSLPDKPSSSTLSINNVGRSASEKPCQ